jgi:hypothetical protein
MSTTITKGIRFEGSGQFLKWGMFIEPLFRKFHGIKEIFSDRTVYNWGKQSILNGLELELTTIFWNVGLQRWFRRFTEIEYHVIGDEIAKHELTRISNHLISLYGQPTVSEDDVDNNETYLLWKLDKIEVSVHYYEQHCYKLQFSIHKKKRFSFPIA